MNYIIESSSALVNENEKEQHQIATVFALVNPDEKRLYHNKGDVPFRVDYTLIL